MSNQFIYLTEPANLQDGLYWARRKPKQGNPYGPWLMVGFIGHSPFLVFYKVIYFDEERREWIPNSNFDGKGGRVENPLNPADWEFGPRIDPPGPRANLSYPPVEMKVTP